MITNANELPTNYESLTGKFLSNISFIDNDIGKLIKGLYLNKAHGHDMMGIPNLKVCGDSVYKPLCLIFMTSLDQGTFSLCWKKTNFVPIHKTNSKQ